MKNLSTEENLSYNHITNLQKASELSDYPILDCSTTTLFECQLKITKNKEVIVMFHEDGMKNELLNLKDYTYILSSFRL